MISHLKHEGASGVAKDGGGELQPEQDGEPRREQPAQVEVLPALGNHGRAREARERNGSSHKRCHQDADKYNDTSTTGKSILSTGFSIYNQTSIDHAKIQKRNKKKNLDTIKCK